MIARELVPAETIGQADIELPGITNVIAMGRTGFAGVGGIVHVGNIESVEPALKIFEFIPQPEIHDMVAAVLFCVGIVHKIGAYMLPFGAGPEAF